MTVSLKIKDNRLFKKNLNNCIFHSVDREMEEAYIFFFLITSCYGLIYVVSL